METINKDYLGKHKKFRIDSKKIATVFFVSAFVVAIFVFWWLKLVGITATVEAFCGLEEHTHGNECYINEIICGFDESTTNATIDELFSTDSNKNSAEESTTVEPHVHTAECLSKTLSCTKAEHTHTQECFPDKTADVETVSDWLSTIENVKITNNIPQNLIAIAISQVGYEESSKNFEYDDEGNRNGYTRYGEWYGNPYGKWNAMFVSFCLKYSEANNSDKLISAGSEAMRHLWMKNALYTDASEHKAKAGELIFIDENNDSAADNVAIISRTDADTTKIVIGDYDNTVKEITVDDTISIIGYGLTHNLLTVSQAQATTVTTEPQPSTTQPPIAFSTTESSTENSEQSEGRTEEKASTTDDGGFTNSDEDSFLAEYEKSLDQSIIDGIENLSSEEKREALLVMYYTDKLPSVDEFYSELDRLYEADDMESEEEYIVSVQRNMLLAYAHFQGVEHCADYIYNLSKMIEIKDVYDNFNFSTYTTGTSSPLKFHYVNRGWSEILPIVIHGGSASEKISTGSNVNQYWHGIVVDYNSTEGYYYVSNKYVGGSSTSATTIKSLKASTSKGFVVFVWMADGSSATTLQKNNGTIASNVAIGDRVTVSKDPTTVSSGYSSSGYGTITFSEYIPPETTQPSTPDPDEPEGDPVVEKFTEDMGEPNEFSDGQIDYIGGKTTSGRGDVQISKYIDGTDIENVFDITLTVRTESTVQTYLEDPDMSVVIVMDISNTMNSKYPAGSSTSRYDAAVVAAENFINQFAEKGKGISKLGFVAFNTHAHEILALQNCTTNNASSLISEMKSETNAIISAAGYADAWTRFTNIEAGLKMGYDMLESSENENKYIVFLSDGFPTTYIESGYNGYDPNDESGTRFYDSVELYNGKKRPCSYGTSYSDEAAIRARKMANNIKNLGATIFSIGVNVSGQSIATYVSNFVGESFSVVDRRSTNYEIGDESKTYDGDLKLTAFENWLKYSIGSTYYYDSNNQTQISEAFNEIFEKIENMNEESRKTIWTTTDPLPVLGEDSTIVEFVHFFDKDGNAVLSPDPKKIEGNFGIGLENTAYHRDRTIYWDLKDSGYTENVSEDGNTTYFYYKIKYRIRLYNENKSFVERQIYETNGNAFLEYKTVVTVDDVTNVSDNKTLYFEKPSVFGYEGEFTFSKQSDMGNPLEGAVFELSHDDKLCSICQGNGTPVTSVSVLGPFVSESDGSINFENIPSGHIYDLKEIECPEGYVDPGRIYKIKISMDELTVYIFNSADATEYTAWTGDETNNLPIYNTPLVYILPETGGTGTLPFAIIGFALMVFPILYTVLSCKRKKRCT